MKSSLLGICFILNCVLAIYPAKPDDSCGQTSTESGWKWHVQLLNTQYEPAQGFKCGGSLLNSLFVATAAHCLYDLNGDPLDKSLLQILLADGEYRLVNRTFQPEPFNVERLSNDYALLLLDRTVDFNELVASICLPKPYTILPQDVHTPVLATGEVLPTNDGTICLGDAKTLFGMIYMDALCLGTFDKTNKYHRNAGSGLYVLYRSSWYLVGIVMYTTGPSSAHVTYIGGIHLERHLKWTSRMLTHYSESMSSSERNCQTYVRNQNLPFEEFHPIVNLVDTEKGSSPTVCRGILVSPRYVLTTSRCASKAKRIFIHYGTEGNSDWFVAQKFSENGRLALIALDRDAKEISGVLSCLHTNGDPKSFNFTTRIAHSDSFARLEGIQVQYRVDKPLKVQYYCSRYLYHGHFTKPGNPLVTKQDNEPFYRVVGILEDVLECQPADYFYERATTVKAINVERYLPWIEDVVWGVN